MKHTNLFILLFVAIVGLWGCNDTQTAAKIEHAQQEAGSKALLRNQPVPTLDFSMERQIVIETYLARNRKLSTWAYTRDMQGRWTEICASMGYPIPYSTQLTNPSQVYHGSNYELATIGNPDPNGLYSPTSSDATIVSCVDKDGSVNPVSVEERVTTFPYRIKHEFEVHRYDENDTSSLKIKIADRAR